MKLDMYTRKSPKPLVKYSVGSVQFWVNYIISNAAIREHVPIYDILYMWNVSCSWTISNIYKVIMYWFKYVGSKCALFYSVKYPDVDISSVLIGAAVGASVMMVLCGVFLCVRCVHCTLIYFYSDTVNILAEYVWWRYYYSKMWGK